LCEIHDAARLDELRLSDLDGAFLPLEVAADKEGLFDYEVYVAERASQIDGFVAFTADELGWLSVDPVQHRSGIGKLLVCHVIKHAGPEISLEVLAGNEPALAFYKAMSVHLIETKSGVMPGNEDFRVTGH
jgi:ribosomal protein S18 acetylase RimI-like enzyme